MKELEIDWRIAWALIWNHSVIMNRITFALLLLLFLISAAVVKIAGYPVQMIFDTIWDHKALFFSVLAVVHFCPVSIYSLVRLIKNQKFKKFRLVLVEYKNSEPPLPW